MFQSLAQNDQAAAYLRIIRRWWWIPIAFALISGLTTYVGTQVTMRPVYAAHITLQVASPLVGYGAPTANDAGSDSVLMTTSPVERLALAHLSPVARRDPAAVTAATCQANSTNIFIDCTTTSHDAAAAAAALNDLARTFIAFNNTQQEREFAPSLSGLQQQEKQLKKEIAGWRSTLATLQAVPNADATTEYRISQLQNQITLDQSSLSQLTVQESTVRQQAINAKASVHVVNPAVPETSAIAPHPLRNALLGLIIGLGLAIALIVLLEYMDDTLHSSEEIEQIAGATVLGAVRRFGSRLVDTNYIPFASPRSSAAEAYRVMRTNLDFVDLDHRHKLVLISSGRESEGKTTTASNLAAATAISGRRVLLVDVDLRRAGLTRRLGLRDWPGLTNALIADDRTVNAVTSDVPNLSIVPSGPLPPNSAQLVDSKQMRDWLRDVRERYDMVILDAPPILSLADTRMLAPQTDGVVLVVDPRASTRRLVRQTRLALEAVHGKLLGLVINQDVFQDQQHHYNYYYYDAYTSAEGSERRQTGDGPESIESVASARSR